MRMSCSVCSAALFVFAASPVLASPVLASPVLTSPAFAASQTPSSAPPALDIRQLAPNAWVLMGTDGNVVIVPDVSGALLIDDERPTDVAEMRAAVKTLTEGPIRYVINTHWHLDHSGGNAVLAGAGATIIAQTNVRERLSTDQFMAAYNSHVRASPPIALPAVTFDQDLTVHFGGETLNLRHTPAAHTDGDAIVKLQTANVLHMGDVFFNGLFPFIDRSSGGGIEGLIAAVDTALGLSDDRTRIVPAHGEIATRAELQAYRAMLVDVRDRVKSQIADGRSLAQVRDSHPAAAYRLDGDADRFVAAVYDSLTAG
jgi:cyclase